MTPIERLDNIKRRLLGCDDFTHDDEDLLWLIARVERLEKALKQLTAAARSAQITFDEVGEGRNRRTEEGKSLDYPLKLARKALAGEDDK